MLTTLTLRSQPDHSAFRLDDFELQLSLNQVMMATFSVEQLHVGYKDFATTITSMQLPHSRKQASFSKNSTVALPQ